MAGRLRLRPALRRYAHSVQRRGGAAAGDIYGSLVAYWKMDEISGTRYDSIGENHLTDIHTPWSADGNVYDLAATFSGAQLQRLEVASNELLDMGDRRFAIGAWVYETARASQNGIFGKAISSNGSLWPFLLRLQNGIPHFYVGDGSAVGSVNTGVAIPLDTWTLIICYHDSVADEIGISVNGSAPVTQPWATGSYSNSDPLTIGSKYNAMYFTGRIGPVMVWRDYIPDADEMAWLYNAGSGLTLAAMGDDTFETPVRIDGAWTWFTKPRAVHYNGQTYIGTIGARIDNQNAIALAAVDHASGKAGMYPLSLGGSVDDHNGPSILIRDSDKRLLAFYCGHNDATQRLRISTNAEDISSWGAEAQLDAQLGGSSYSYANPIQLTGEVDDPIYLFYRDFGVPGLCFSKSTDGGATWAAQTWLFGDGVNRPYFQMIANGDDRIDFAVNDGHPNAVATNSLYHFYYQGGNYYQTDGTLIGDGTALPLEAADVTLVYDGTTYRCWVWDIAIDGSGYPVIAYTNFPDVTDHRYRYARWNGTSWDDYEITAGGTYLYSGEPYYSGGIALDQSNPNICYLSKQVSGQWEIYKYVTADGGATWTDTAITSGSSEKNIRPEVPRNAHPDLQVIWLAGTYTSYTVYDMRVRGYPAGILD